MFFEGEVSRASAQDFQQIAPSNPGVKEFFREGADISGAVVLGVQSQAAPSRGPHLISHLPQAWSGETACINIVAADGRYEAYGNYLVPAVWKGGPAVLDFDTAYAELWRAIPHDGVGAMISRGACGQGGAEDLSVVWWDTPQSKAVDIIINSFNADEVFIYVGESQTPIMCKRLALTSTIAYDRKCAISPSDHTGPTKVEIYRVNGGKPSAPTSLVIWFPEAG